MPVAREVVSDIDDMSHGEVRVSEGTFLVEDISCDGIGQDSVFRLATGDEFA